MGNPDLSLVLSALRGEVNDARIADDASAFLDLAEQHHLTGLIARALGNDADRVPNLRERAASRKTWTRFQLGAAQRIASALKAQGIRTIFVKGVALALTVYDEIGQRPFYDLDILVAEPDVPRVHDVLTELDYVRAPVRPGRQVEAGYFLEKWPGRKIWVDLHWGFTLNDWLQAPVKVCIPEILERATARREFLLPSTEDSMILAAAHLARTDFLRVGHIIDFGRLATAPLDWSDLLSRANTARLRTPLWLGLMLAVEWFDAKVSAEALRELEPSGWQQNWLRRVVARLLRLNMPQSIKDLILLKALSLDSWNDRLHAALVCPLGLWRNLRTWVWSAKAPSPQEPPAPSAEPPGR